MKFSLGKVYSIIWNIFCVAILLIFIIVEVDINTVCLYGTLIMSLNFFMYCQLFSVFLCPYTLFFIIFVLFQYGECILGGFGMEEVSVNFQTVVYSILATIFFNQGAILVTGDARLKTGWEKRVISVLNHNERTVYFFRGLFIISGIMGIPGLIRYSLMGWQIGYYANLITAETVTTNIARQVFIPAGIGILAYSKIKVEKIICAGFMCFIGGISLLSGARAMGISVLSAMVIYFYFYVDVDKKIKKIILAVSGAGLMVIIPGISIIRNAVGKTRGDFISVLKDVVDDNPLKLLISEMGVSIMPTDWVMSNIHYKFEYFLGASYLAGIITVFPASLDPTGTISRLKETAHLAIWLQNVQNSLYGPGFSLIAESFLNFGWFGIFAMLGLGVIVGKVLDSSDVEKENRFQLYSKIGMMFWILLSTRDSSMVIWKGFFYIYIVYPLFAALFVSIKK